MHGTVLNRTVPRRTVPPRVGGLDRSRTVRYDSINGIAPFGTVFPAICVGVLYLDVNTWRYRKVHNSGTSNDGELE